MFEFFYQGETGFTLNQTDNGLLAVFADDGIGFPVTNPAACFDYGWTLLNELPIRYDAAMVILSVVLFMLFLATQLLPWQPACALVSIDALIYGFQTDVSIIADLLRAPLLQRLVLGELPSGIVYRLGIYGATFLCYKLCLLGSIAAPPLVTG